MSKYKGFKEVELRRPQRSTFDLSHERRISSRIGKLTPCFITETLPNDTFYGSSEVIVKLAPLIAPIYHRLNLYVHYFFVPNRLLWEDWETFITGGNLGEAVSTPPVPPYMEIDTILGDASSYLDVGSLMDHLGMPPIPDSEYGNWEQRSIDLMPVAAFYKIFLDYYRDRNYSTDAIMFEDALPLPSGDNAGTTLSTGIFVTRYRAWQHDYFTSALPFTQRGAEVLMPLQGSVSSGTFKTGDVRRSSDNALISGSLAGDTGVLEAANVPAYLDITGQGEIDSSNVSINDLRRAVRLQEWLERNALAGSRYNESIMAHFGRKTSDARLQRAEYIGGGKAVIQISEVMTTAYSEDADAAVIPPASMSGRGSTYANTNAFSYNCEEHGFIVGVLSVMPTSAYMQGIPRMFQARNTFLDYPWPTFAHLGEQEVYDWELFTNTTNVTQNREDAPVFGYQSRYSDWKHISSSSHGDFRTSLDMWHLTRKFSATPELGAAFVTFEDALQDRVFNVEGVDTLWMYVYNQVKVKRSLPYFGTPEL